MPEVEISSIGPCVGCHGLSKQFLARGKGRLTFHPISAWWEPGPWNLGKEQAGSITYLQIKSVVCR